MQALRAVSELPSYQTKVQGLDVHYKCLGKGPPVILLHGSGNDWHEWKKNLVALAQSFQVYAPDLPGFGLSQGLGVPLSGSWGASFLKNFMEVLNIDSAHLIGHSLGGLVALSFALDWPVKVKKLVLVASAGLGEVKSVGRVRLFLIRETKRLFGKEKSPKYKKTPGNGWLLLHRLPELTPETTVVWGDWDPYLSVSQAKLAYGLIPHCQLWIFRRCGHAPQRERSKAFNALISGFLKDWHCYGK